MMINCWTRFMSRAVRSSVDCSDVVPSLGTFCLYLVRVGPTGTTSWSRSANALQMTGMIVTAPIATSGPMAWARSCMGSNWLVCQGVYGQMLSVSVTTKGAELHHGQVPVPQRLAARREVGLGCHHDQKHCGDDRLDCPGAPPRRISFGDCSSQRCGAHPWWTSRVRRSTRPMPRRSRAGSGGGSIRFEELGEYLAGFSPVMNLTGSVVDLAAIAAR
jgi:hypothetical protein